MNTRNNARWRASEKKIVSAALELLEELPPGKLTVKAVCKRAGVNRTTFYAHFDSIPALLEHLEEHIHRAANDRSLDIDAPVLSAGSIIPFLQTVQDNRRFYEALLPTRQHFPLEEGTEEILDLFFRPRCAELGITDERAIALAHTFAQAGFTNLLRNWVESGCELSKEEVARVIEFCVEPVLGGEGREATREFVSARMSE